MRRYGTVLSHSEDYTRHHVWDKDSSFTLLRTWPMSVKNGVGSCRLGRICVRREYSLLSPRTAAQIAIRASRKRSSLKSFRTSRPRRYIRYVSIAIQVGVVHLCCMYATHRKMKRNFVDTTPMIQRLIRWRRVDNVPRSATQKIATKRGVITSYCVLHLSAEARRTMKLSNKQSSRIRGFADRGRRVEDQKVPLL